MSLKKKYLDTLLRKKTKQSDVELEATIVSHPNGLIVVQLTQPLQSIFLSAEEACAIAKALLLEARRVRVRRVNGA